MHQAWTYDWESEERRQSDTCLLREDKTHYDRIDADEDGEKCEEEERGEKTDELQKLN